MSGVERKRLDGVLEGYIAQHPKLATLQGDEFIIKPRRLGPVIKVALVIAAVVMLLFVAVGVFMVVLGLGGSNVEDRSGTVWMGLILIVFGGGLIFLFVYARLSRGIVDLNTGDFKMKSLFGTRTRVNLADVVSYNRLEQRTQGSGAGTTINVVCQLQTVVPGKHKPKTKTYQFAVFNNAQAFTDFEPVVNALIAYFRGQR